MKLSKETKDKALTYVNILKEKIKTDTGIEVTTRMLIPVKQKLENQMHLEAQKIAEAFKIIDDLGYVADFSILKVKPK